MEFVKITFPTKEDIGTCLYDSVAAAMEILPDVTPNEGQVGSLYEMGQGMINTFMQMPMPQMGKIPLEEWSSPPPPQGEKP